MLKYPVENDARERRGTNIQSYLFFITERRRRPVTLFLSMTLETVLLRGRSCRSSVLLSAATAARGECLV